MNILLLSMPDSFEHTPPLTMRMPNGALASLAGNIDAHHRVAVADLVLVQSSVRHTVERLLAELEPDLVGLSVMTFQRVTARRIISLIRSLRPAARIAVGGYDPSLAPEAWTDPELGVDFIVRGEGEITFRELLRAIEGQTPLRDVAGLLFRDGTRFQQGPPRPVAAIARGVSPCRTARPRALRLHDARAPDRRRRDLPRVYFDCSFCSIIEMRGRNFHLFPIERVIEDLRDAHRRGARAIFLVDDNITIDVPRFEALCRAIVDAGLDTIDYIIQGMTSAIAAHGEHLVPLMRKAGIRYVFLGIENVLADDLAFLKASAKNRNAAAA